MYGGGRYTKECCRPVDVILATPHTLHEDAIKLLSLRPCTLSVATTAAARAHDVLQQRFEQPRLASATLLGLEQDFRSSGLLNSHPASLTGVCPMGAPVTTRTPYILGDAARS